MQYTFVEECLLSFNLYEKNRKFMRTKLDNTNKIITLWPGYVRNLEILMWFHEIFFSEEFVSNLF